MPVEVINIAIAYWYCSGEFMDSFQTVDDAMFRQTSTRRPEKLITKMAKPTHMTASTLTTPTSSERSKGLPF